MNKEELIELISNNKLLTSDIFYLDKNIMINDFKDLTGETYQDEAPVTNRMGAGFNIGVFKISGSGSKQTKESKTPLELILDFLKTDNFENFYECISEKDIEVFKGDEKTTHSHKENQYYKNSIRALCATEENKKPYYLFLEPNYLNLTVKESLLNINEHSIVYGDLSPNLKDENFIIIKRKNKEIKLYNSREDRPNTSYCDSINESSFEPLCIIRI